MLTDAKIKAAKPKASAYKLGDSGQLYLYVTTAGGRHWRMNYSYGTNDSGKPAQKTLTLGSYPSTSLVEARAKRDEAKKLLSAGRDPAVEKKVAAKARAQTDANTFEIVGRRWYDLRKGGWSPVHANDVIDSLTNDLFPAIGDLPITAIGAPKLLEVLQAVERRGAIETAHRLRQRASAIFVYGIASGICDADPAASLGKALKDKPRSKKQPSIVDGIRDQAERMKIIRKMLADCDAQRCRAGTKFGLRFLALTAVRPGELRFASWPEFEGIDWTKPDEPAPAAVWRIPAERMKGDEDRKAEEYGEHVVPLSPQAVEVLHATYRLSGGLPYLFPSERHVHKPISENTLRALLIRAGYYQRHVPHGFRAAFSTYMNDRPAEERRDGDRAVIDLMLAHVPGNKVEGAYNRAAYMGRRRELACEWADLITAELEPPATHLGKPIRWADTSPKAPRQPAAYR